MIKKIIASILVLIVWATAHGASAEQAPNFPEGFRQGYELRGFKAGHARFPLSDKEEKLIAEMRGRLGVRAGRLRF